ncbi:hypothetical protein EV208_102152 [Christensenella hongkongensis]|uniref:Uncharacterized protein n=1 Tax=Christensenella hongkongensis TaxID=270498 RepID=A0A0M2NKU7_9FIRM|nr:hypothetical protein CHK_1444 [Christensenella hongkongensis]TCW30529.1 hypothetical protein EV208_102152 [Christensenella hongkongensis]
MFEYFRFKNGCNIKIFLCLKENRYEHKTYAFPNTAFWHQKRNEMINDWQIKNSSIYLTA